MKLSQRKSINQLINCFFFYLNCCFKKKFTGGAHVLLIFIKMTFKITIWKHLLEKFQKRIMNELYNSFYFATRGCHLTVIWARLDFYFDVTFSVDSVQIVLENVFHAIVQMWTGVFSKSLRCFRKCKLFVKISPYLAGSCA